MGITIKDIVALATAGYKVSEVKELLSLANQSETKSAEEGEEDQPEKTEQHEAGKEQHEAGKEQPEEAPKKGTDTPEEDSAILSYKQKIEELEAQVQKLQSANVHKDQSGKETKNDEDLLNELTQTYM